MKNLKLKILMTILAIAAAAPASASLIGITTTISGAGQSCDNIVVSGMGSECTLSNQGFDSIIVDILDSSIRFDFIDANPKRHQAVHNIWTSIQQINFSLKHQNTGHTGTVSIPTIPFSRMNH